MINFQTCLYFKNVQSHNSFVLRFLSTYLDIHLEVNFPSLKSAFQYLLCHLKTKFEFFVKKVSYYQSVFEQLRQLFLDYNQMTQIETLNIRFIELWHHYQIYEYFHHAIPILAKQF
ncbi:unnamed protein product [Paramecium octaurelia]|uniref:Uncharacterized protein n=1 Tax=Paramecium octaurelia TaxID=43137 RepID=A0A8S1X8E9_PAROT|nr:unnamed protein product [Paramecium octaurelia]